MALKKYIFRIAVCGCALFALPACNDDELDPESIFPRRQLLTNSTSGARTII